MMDFEVIRNAVEDINDITDNLDCAATENECTNIRCNLREIERELDDFEPPEPDFPEGYERIHKLLPDANTLSEGEMEDLELALKGWRFRNGMPIV